jgi:dolichol-phosphate mannosyltransferase
VSRTVVVIPTYNEAENLPLIVPQVLEQDPGIEVLVVDDASPDGTGKIADDLALQHSGRVHALHREGERGLGRAYRDGLARALELGADQVIQMDADFSHPPATLKTMLEKIATCDVVLGSRYLKGITVVNWPLERILISWFANQYARLVTGMPISDQTGGFRCTRRELLERIEFRKIRSDGYAFQIEMNYRLYKYGARLEEIPFFFLDRERGESKLSLGIAVEALWICPWMRVASWIGRL